MDPVITATATTSPAPTGTPTPRPTRTPSLTPLPCAPATMQPVPDHPEYVIHYDGCTVRERDTIETAFNWAIEAVPPGVQLGEIQVYVFDNNIEGVAEVENMSKRRGGFDTNSLDEVKANWGGGGGEALPDGTIIIYFGRWWKTQTRESRMHTILHEVHHLVQYRMSGLANFWNAHIPVWWVEGGAEYYSGVTVAQHGLTDAKDEPALERCHYTLEELSEWATLDGDCIYAQAPEAQYVLDQLYGEQKYLELLAVIRQYGFESGFERIYNMSVEDFDVLFQQYSNSGYQVLPTLPAATEVP